MRSARQRAPDTMLDVRPKSARLPGYTGHQPGIVSESLIGRYGFFSPSLSSSLVLLMLLFQNVNLYGLE